MSGIDIDAVASQAAQAIVRSAARTGKDLVSYAQAEAKKLATSAAEIATLRVAGQIDDDDAKFQLDIQVQASRAVLAGIEGMSMLGAEEAINAGLSVIGKAIQAATGLALFA